MVVDYALQKQIFWSSDDFGQFWRFDVFNRRRNGRSVTVGQGVDFGQRPVVIVVHSIFFQIFGLKAFRASAVEAFVH